MIQWQWRAGKLVWEKCPLIKFHFLPHMAGSNQLPFYTVLPQGRASLWKMLLLFSCYEKGLMIFVMWFCKLKRHHGARMRSLFGILWGKWLNRYNYYYVDPKSEHKAIKLAHIKKNTHSAYVSVKIPSMPTLWEFLLSRICLCCKQLHKYIFIITEGFDFNGWRVTTPRWQWSYLGRLEVRKGFLSASLPSSLIWIMCLGFISSSSFYSL